MEIINTCPYCKRKFKGNGHNPEEPGLRDYIDWNKVNPVCDFCEFLVVQTNKKIKEIIDSDGSDNSMKKFEEHTRYIRELYNRKEEKRKTCLNPYVDG